MATFEGTEPLVWFGRSAWVDQGTILISNPPAPPYVERAHGGWAVQQDLFKMDAGLSHAQKGGFGWPVMHRGDWAVIGDSVQQDGRVYVFHRPPGQRAWVQAAKLAADPPDAQDENGFLGTSVAISPDGRFVVGGAPNHYVPPKIAGSAFIWEQTAPLQWTQVAWCSPNAAVTFKPEFGRNVDVSGETVAVAADTDATGLGAVYLYERQPDGTWPLKVKLTPPPPTNIFMAFGSGVSLDLDGQRLAVGAPGATHPSGTLWVGCVYIYERTPQGVWSPRAQIFPADGLPYTSFGGGSVALRGDMLLVAAPSDLTLGVSAGAALVFHETSPGQWKQVAKLLAPDGAALDDFGRSVSLSGNLAVIGTLPYDLNQPLKPGKAYVFAVSPDLDEDGVMDACECAGDINKDWIVDAADLNLLLAHLGCQSNQRDCVASDVDADGDVDQLDLNLVLAAWGSICP